MKQAGNIGVVFSGVTRKYNQDLKAAQANTNQWAAQTERSADRINAAFKKVGIGMVAVGAIIAGVMVKTGREYMKAGDELHKMGQRTGFAVRELDKLSFIAQRSGTDINAVENAIRRMNRNIFTAGEVSGKTAETMKAMGLNVDEIRKMKPEEAFNAMLRGLAGVENQSMRSAYAQELFGRQGTALLPIIAQGEDALNKLTAEAEKHAWWTDESAKQAARLQDAMTTLQTSLRAVAMTLIEPLIPYIIRLAEFIGDKLLPAIREWMDENPALVASITKLTAATALVLIPMGLFLMSIKLFKGLGFAKLIGGAVKAVGLLAKGLFFLFLPALKFIAAAGLMGAAAWAVWKNWEELKPLFTGFFQWVIDKAKWAWEGIKAGARWAAEALVDAYQWGVNQAARAMNALLTAGTAIANGLVAVFEFMARQITHILNAPIRAINALLKNRLLTWGMERLGMETPEQIGLITAPEIGRFEAPRIEAPDVREGLAGAAEVMKDTGKFIWDAFADEAKAFGREIKDDLAASWLQYLPEELGKQVDLFKELPDDIGKGIGLGKEKLDEWLAGFAQQVGLLNEPALAGEADMSMLLRSREEFAGAGGITREEMFALIGQRPQTVELKTEVNNPMSPQEEDRLIRRMKREIIEMFNLDRYKGQA